jgi:1-acyl-sn-glycerol-3-phosphate acyltransferase
MKAWALLGDRAFLPFFASQFTVAFNDNLLKTGLVLLLTFGTGPDGGPLRVFGMDAATLNPLAAALLILPFLVFSSTAGQMADRHPRRSIIVTVKAVEVVLMTLAGLGFVLTGAGQPAWGLSLLLVLLPIAGAQSAFYSPARYSVLPELVEPARLVAANAMLQLGSYLSILGGVIAAGVLLSAGAGAAVGGVALGPLLMAGVLVGMSAFGWWCSVRIPPTLPGNPDQRVDWLSPAATLRELGTLHREPVLRRTVVGISWFWAFAACLLTLFPVWSRDQIGGGPEMATFFMALFSVGIGAGSLLCSRLSPHGLELGVVAVGALGLSALPLLLPGLGGAVVAEAGPLAVLDLLSQPSGVVLSLVLVGIAAMGGLFIVPLYTLLQTRPADHERGRVMAATNLTSSLWIVLSQGALMVLAGRGWEPPAIFVLLAALNFVGFLYLYLLIPEFLYRFMAWVLSHLLYRLRVDGIERIPATGGVLLVCNHVSFIDWLIVGGSCPRPARFVMDKFMFQIPVVTWLVRHAGAIPIASRKVDPALLEQAWDRIAAALEAGEVVCIFPEGGLTRDGEPLPWRPGVERIVARNPVPVVPMALNGLWGSFFSRIEGTAMARPLRRGFRAPLRLTVGDPLAPEGLTVDQVREAVLAMWSQHDAR